MSSQSTAKKANVSAEAVLAEACLALPSLFDWAVGLSAEACFDFPVFLASGASGASTIMTLSSSLASSASIGGAVSEAHSVIGRRIFSPSGAKEISRSNEMTGCDTSSPVRAKPE